MAFREKRPAMRKFSVILIVAAVVITLLPGCSSGSQGSGKSVDEQFIASVGKGLESHWEVSNEKGEIDNAQEIQSIYKAELDQIKSYKDAKFEDAALQEKAVDYIQCVQDMYDRADTYFSGRSMDFQDLMGHRAELISDFAENYGLTVSKEYTDRLDSDVSYGKRVAEDRKYKDEIQKMVDRLKFKLTEDDEYQRTYTAILENTSDKTLSSLDISINLLDKDGVIVDTNNAGVTNVKPGQKARIEFYTSTKFKDTDITLGYYSVE